MVARYAVHTAKAAEVIVWLANAEPEIDVYHIVKAAFYADKLHIRRYGRPISGDDYDADTYGPLARVAYRLLRGDPIEMIALGGNGTLPFRIIDRQSWKIVADREPNIRILSKSDVQALSEGLALVRNLSFDELVTLTHDEPAYIAANGGRMQYERMLDEQDPLWADKAKDLAETARHAVF